MISSGEQSSSRGSHGAWARRAAWIALALTPVAACVTDPNYTKDIAHHYVIGDTTTEERISAALTRVVGKHVIVVCRGFADPDQAGKAYDRPYSPLPPVIALDNGVCKLLDGLAQDPSELNPFAASAVVVAAHELSHLTGDGHGFVRDEAAVQCYGVQRVENVALALGATPDVATGLAEIAADVPMSRRPDYTPPADCVDGGRLDLDPLHGPGHFPAYRAE